MRLCLFIVNVVIIFMVFILCEFCSQIAIFSNFAFFGVLT